MNPITRHALTPFVAAALVATTAAPAQTPAAPAKEAASAPVEKREVKSKDGTRIAFDRSGEGRTLILVSGALSDRSDLSRLAALLSKRFTVVNYDRRGRGESGDAPRYAVEREVEDIEALIDASGGSARLFGHSSGAVLALEAATRLGPKVSELAIYEPPFVVDDTRPRVPADFAKHVRELVSAGKRGDAVAYFMTDAVGVPAQFVEQMRQMPMWAGMEKRAHTLVYDVHVMGDTQAGKPLPEKRWTAEKAPIVVMHGGASDPWIQNSARALAKLIPHAKLRALEGQDHSVAVMAPHVLAPVLIEELAE